MKAKRLWFLSLIILLTTNQLSIAQEVAVRKNINNLSAEELATYEHAIQILRDRSAKNPYVLDGYAWQAWVHNVNYVNVPKNNELKQGDMDPTEFYIEAADKTYTGGTNGYPGMCEHAKDIFFLWHRAQFYYFEKILQETDPNGTIKDSKGNAYPTKNLGVPYWNFTEKPGGVRFPKVFEDKSSVLYHAGRHTAAEEYPFTSPYLLAYLLKNPSWPEFGGYVNGTEGGYGSFERMIHNPMHSTYIGGSMASPPTAAYDPIFYSFHSYIDFVLEEWINQHGNASLTSLDYFLRAEQPKQFNLPGYDPGIGDRPNMGQCKLYLDREKLGYTYDTEAYDEVVSPEMLAKLTRKNKRRDLVFGKDKESLFYRLFTTDGTFGPQTKAGDVTNSEIGLDKTKLKDQGVYVYYAKMAKRSYQVDVYVHPKKVKADISSVKFRKKYFASLGVAWIGSEYIMDHSAMDEGEMDHSLNINLEHVIKDLYKKNNGETWTMTINKTEL